MMSKEELAADMKRASEEEAARKKRWEDLFPMTVKSIKLPEDLKALRPPLWGAKVGDLVAIRPCGKEYGDKTYLGLMVGDVALSSGVSYDKDKQELSFNISFHNPAILIPELGKVVYGCESWWGKISKPEDFKQITDLDIDNVWYVQALKKMAKEATDGPQQEA